MDNGGCVQQLTGVVLLVGEWKSPFEALRFSECPHSPFYEGGRQALRISWRRKGDSLPQTTATPAAFD